MTPKRRDICALRLLEIVTHQNVESRLATGKSYSVFRNVLSVAHYYNSKFTTLCHVFMNLRNFSKFSKIPW